MRRYHIQDRDDYKRYNKLAGQVTALVHRLRGLDAQDATRIELTDQMLDKYGPSARASLWAALLKDEACRHA